MFGELAVKHISPTMHFHININFYDAMSMAATPQHTVMENKRKLLLLADIITLFDLTLITGNTWFDYMFCGK